MTRPTLTLPVTLPVETVEVYLRARMMPEGVSSAVARAIEKWDAARRAAQQVLDLETTP
jgi:hypothetical protein